MSDKTENDDMHAMTLRISVKLYEPLRIEAFERRVPISDVIREAVEAHLARPKSTKGCDVCGKPHTHVTTPGGMRGCDDHFRRSSAVSTPPAGEQAEAWECGPHTNAWNGHDARCRRVVVPPATTDGGER